MAGAHARIGRNRGRAVRETALVVVEGAAEVEFLGVLRRLYTAGGLGRSVVVRNAGGKGALHVIREAGARKRVEQHTIYAALFDADQDWDERSQALARRLSVRPLVNEPCLERTLLLIAGINCTGTTDDCKRAFERRFGGVSHAPGLIGRHFDLAQFEAAKLFVPVMSDILEVFGR